jgi:hypothetical protein
VCHSAEAIPKLVFDAAQSGVQKSGVGQHKREQEAPKLVEAVLETHKVLREILNNLKESPGGLFLLKQLAS